ncbi:MAG: beta-N-acetylhexosaminidase [Candidatus Cloacimonetes bacterium]|nr:beta-N-acetylhexosaminidase [Candidatus Cloacimonadota bacterium]
MEIKKTDLMLLPFPAEVSFAADMQEIASSCDLPEESYVLQVNAGKVTLNASGASGYFYGEQTLSQLRRQFGEILPDIMIKDAPRFAWRGLHLDVSRHFFPISTIRKLLQAMSYYKLNRFHWHLTDDQGWRLPIDKYPLLTGYGEYYTKDEIRELVAYAQELHIEIIPEIELPGHSVAALAAYPQYSCRGVKLDMETRWGVFEDVYCPGKDETVEFLKDVLSEVCELFPGRWLHIGGDECPRARWKECPHCQKRIRDAGLADESALQGWLMDEMAQFLVEKGKIPLGWDEIMDSAVNSEIVVMIWRGDGEDARKKALAKQQSMIMCPNFYCYFDWKQTAADNEHGSFGITSLSKTYSYNPAVNPETENLVLGLQGNIWTERIITEKELFYMAFPRALAIAETGWTGEKREFHNLVKRVEAQQGFWEMLGITPCLKME